MGLHPLDLDTWFEIDDDWAGDLAEKRRLLAERRSDVFAAQPGSEPACAEIEDAVLAFVRARGRTPVLDGAEHPLLRAALVVQEDLLVMERRDGAWYLTAGSLSFPTNWHLGEKMGRELDEIHAPVPGYDRDLGGGTVPAFFDRLTVDRPVWRANWTVTDDPGLRLEPELKIRPHRSMTPEEAAEALHLRIERQTLRRFPRTDAVLFTVRIHRRPIATLVDQPDVAARLADGIEGLPDDVGRYKDSTTRWAEPLVAWLRTVS